MSTLLEIADDLLAFKSLLDEYGDELTPEVEAALDVWFAELDAKSTDKLDAYAGLIREYELRAAARREEAERLAMRVRVDENAVRRLKDRLKLFLELTGTKKVETRRYRISLASNGGKLPVESTYTTPEQLPELYQLRLVAADKEKIREHLESGLSVPFCKLGERGTHLRIG